MTTDAKPLTTDEIEELEWLEREATPGEWGVLIAPESHGRWREIYADGPQRVAVLSRANADINGAFIAALRNAAPSLLSSARALTSALARAEAAEARIASLLDRLRTECGVPSEGHDYVDEVLGLLRVERSQRDDAWRERDEARAERDEARAEAEAERQKLMLGGMRLLVRKPCLLHAGEHTVEECAALSAAASLRERVRALDEGLRKFVEAWPAYGDTLSQHIFGIDGRKTLEETSAARGRFVQALWSARALLAPTKETTPASPPPPEPRDA